MRKVLFFSILIGLGQTASAQGVGTFSQPHEVRPQSQVSRAIAQCAYGRDRDGAVALARARGEAEEAQAFKRVRKNMVACLRGQPSATLDLLHVKGAIAEQALLEDDGRLLDRFSEMAPEQPERIEAGKDAGEAVLECAVAAVPALAAEMLRAPAETVEEAAVFRRMAPTLQACAPPEGAITIKPSLVRVLIATAAFRRVTGGHAS